MQLKFNLQRINFGTPTWLAFLCVGSSCYYALFLDKNMEKMFSKLPSGQNNVTYMAYASNKLLLTGKSFQESHK